MMNWPGYPLPYPLGGVPARAPMEQVSDGSVHGVVGKVLGAATLSAAGQVLVQGSLNASLAALVASAAGQVPAQGALAGTLGALTLSSAGLIVPKDGPGNVYVPTLSADWATLGISTPTGCWGCQEASGNLAASIGSLTLTANASPTYAHAVTGWTRTFLGFTDGTAGQRFGTTDSSLDLASNESFAMLVYAAVDSGGTRRIACFSNTNTIRVTSGGLPQIEANGTAASGAQNHESSGATTVRPWLYVRNASADTSKLYTDLEEVSVTHSELALTGQTRCIGGSGTNAVPTMRVGLFAVWKGSGANSLGKTTLSALGWSLAY